MKRICLAVLLVGLLSVPSYSGAEISAPTGVEATEGKYANAIVITWDPVPGAIGYEVWIINTDDYYCGGPEQCDPRDFIIATLTELVDPNNPYTYDLMESSPSYETREYRIKAFDDDSTSDFSLPAYGYILEGGQHYPWECDVWDDCGWGAVPGGGLGGCFIATAAFGSYWESQVMTLRQFRDSYLLTNKLGTRFVKAYYKYSPPMADYIAEHDGLRSMVRIGLVPLVGFSWLAMNYGMLVTLIVLISVITLIVGGTCIIIRTCVICQSVDSAYLRLL